MEMITNLIGRLDTWLDRTGEKLKKKEMSVPTDLVGGIFFLLFGIAMLFVIPAQIVVKKKEIVNGRQFPSMLMYIMIGCAVILIITQIIKILRHQEIKRTKLNLLVEVRAALVFANMLIYYFACQWTGSFAISSCLFVVLMLFFFRCKKWNYYVIALTAALLIWAAFKFGLNVDF